MVSARASIILTLSWLSSITPFPILPGSHASGQLPADSMLTRFENGLELRPRTPTIAHKNRDTDSGSTNRRGLAPGSQKRYRSYNHTKELRSVKLKVTEERLEVTEESEFERTLQSLLVERQKLVLPRIVSFKFWNIVSRLQILRDKVHRIERSDLNEMQDRLGTLRLSHVRGNLPQKSVRDFRSLFTINKIDARTKAVLKLSKAESLTDELKRLLVEKSLIKGYSVEPQIERLEIAWQTCVFQIIDFLLSKQLMRPEYAHGFFNDPAFIEKLGIYTGIQARHNSEWPYAPFPTFEHMLEFTEWPFLHRIFDSLDQKGRGLAVYFYLIKSWETIDAEVNGVLGGFPAFRDIFQQVSDLRFQNWMRGTSDAPELFHLTRRMMVFLKCILSKDRPQGYEGPVIYIVFHVLQLADTYLYPGVISTITLHDRWLEDFRERFIMIGDWIKYSEKSNKVLGFLSFVKSDVQERRNLMSKVIYDSYVKDYVESKDEYNRLVARLKHGSKWTAWAKNQHLVLANRKIEQEVTKIFTEFSNSWFSDDIWARRFHA